MERASLNLIDDAARARIALSPVRRQMLEALRTPASAVELAARLGLSRQKVGYHLRALESAGLVQLAEERRRRGFTERRMVASATAFVVDPAIMGGPAPAGVDKQDAHAAEHLVAAAASVVREVTRMRAAAETEGSRLLTFTIETQVGFERPQDIERFTAALAEAVADLARQFDANRAKRRYRVLIGGHPAVAGEVPAKIN